MQGYSSKDRRVSLFDDWDLSESVSAEPSEVCYMTCQILSYQWLGNPDIFIYLSVPSCLVIA